MTETTIIASNFLSTYAVQPHKDLFIEFPVAGWFPSETGRAYNATVHVLPCRGEQVSCLLVKIGLELPCDWQDEIERLDADRQEWHDTWVRAINKAAETEDWEVLYRLAKEICLDAKENIQ